MPVLQQEGASSASCSPPLGPRVCTLRPVSSSRRRPALNERSRRPAAQACTDALGWAAGEGSGALVRLYAHAWRPGNGDAVCRAGLDIRPGSHGRAGRRRGRDARAPQAGGALALEEWVELANGCLCCSVKDDFVQALEALMQRRARFDYILVETTGAPRHEGHRLPPSPCRRILPPRLGRANAVAACAARSGSIWPAWSGGAQMERCVLHGVVLQPRLPHMSITHRKSCAL